MADEVEVRLARMRKALVKLSREGREREFAAVAEAYRALKAEQMEAAEVEWREAARARLAARRAVRPSPGRGEWWRLPRGFSSPLARERAAQGLDRGPLLPDSRRPALAPWRRSHPMEEVLWRPGQ